MSVPKEIDKHELKTFILNRSGEGEDIPPQNFFMRSLLSLSRIDSAVTEISELKARIKVLEECLEKVFEDHVLIDGHFIKITK